MLKAYNDALVDFFYVATAVSCLSTIDGGMEECEGQETDLTR